MRQAVLAMALCSLASVATGQTQPPPQPLAPPVRSQPLPASPQTATPERPDHWFYKMLDKSDPRHLTDKKPAAPRPVAK